MESTTESAATAFLLGIERLTRIAIERIDHELAQQRQEIPNLTEIQGKIDRMHDRRADWESLISQVADRVAAARDDISQHEHGLKKALDSFQLARQVLEEASQGLKSS